MFTATISDIGLSYKADTVADISTKLYEYVMESYGTHTVLNMRDNTVLNSCKRITSPGEYMITTKHDNMSIYCIIS